MERCIISYQEVLSSLIKNGNHQAVEALLRNHCINSQLLRIPYWLGVFVLVGYEIFPDR
jgi:lipoate-protein ligase A